MEITLRISKSAFVSSILILMQRESNEGREDSKSLEANTKQYIVQPLVLLIFYHRRGKNEFIHQIAKTVDIIKFVRLIVRTRVDRLIFQIFHSVAIRD